MTAGTLVEWHRHPGDAVKRGDIIADVDTDKGVIEIEVFTDGVIDQILVRPGQKVPVGTPLALIRESGAPAVGEPAIAVGTPAAAPAPGLEPARAPPAPKEPSGPRRIRISPLAARIARELQLDPETVLGTGPGGVVTRDDVERAAAARKAPDQGATAPDRATRMRQAIGAAMARSKRDIPHYYLGTTVDLARALAWMTDANRSRPVTDRLVPGALFLKAVALALREFPELNGTWTDGGLRSSDAIHVGVAIALRQGGLVAPALHHADRQSLDELMRNLRDLVQRTRAGSFRSSELADGTITVTSLGDRGAESVFGVIYPPQVAIVGFGAVNERPFADQGRIDARPAVTVTLSADHRASDGHRGGLFLAAVAALLRDPERL
jgi:pyruvate dehydrogenase E2 component (dihydrolipoamide acetyltransferase)